MSLGGGANTSLDTAVRTVIADGVSCAFAAGNGNILCFPVNSCNQSPARVAEGTTVGASDINDAKAMASQHVAGVAALFLQNNQSPSPALVQQTIKDLSTKVVVTGTSGGLFGGSTPNNHLLFTNF
jgi:subtilisin family serine protease